MRAQQSINSLSVQRHNSQPHFTEQLKERKTPPLCHKLAQQHLNY